MTRAFIVLFSLTCSITAPVSVLGQIATPLLNDHPAVGAWYGRALPNDPSTAPVPEVIMLVSFFSDGTLIANDAIEEIIPHATAHGHWQPTGERTLQGTFIWLNLTEESPTGFAGTFKVIMDAFIHPDTPNTLGGTIEAWVFPPGTDPLDPNNTGATPLGRFTIAELARVQSNAPADIVQDRANDLSVGAWYGRALPDDPSTAPAPQITMMPTFYADGNLIANDALEMLIPHNTAHGHWVLTGPNQVEGTFIWLNISNETSNGLTGIFKVRLTSLIDASAPNTMSGTLEAWVFPPDADPLDPNNSGGLALGTFTIDQLARIQSTAESVKRDAPVDPSAGTWYGRALADDPSNAPVSELIMMPTFNADGNLIANHATETILSHGTGHGTWVSTGVGTTKSTFMWLNLSAENPNGFTGTYKINLDGRIDAGSPNTMHGTLEAWSFPPGTDPLDPNNTGALPLGKFTIESFTRVNHFSPQPTAIEQPATAPLTFALDGIYPNPFNPQTSVTFTLANDASIRLEVFNNQGQLVRTLVDGRRIAGHFSTTWNGTNNQGIPVASGIYLFRLSSGTTTQIKKATLLK